VGRIPKLHGKTFDPKGNRAHGSDTRAELVAAGYHGDIIRDAWIKDARI